MSDIALFEEAIDFWSKSEIGAEGLFVDDISKGGTTKMYHLANGKITYYEVTSYSIARKRVMGHLGQFQGRGATIFVLYGIVETYTLTDIPFTLNVPEYNVPYISVSITAVGAIGSMYITFVGAVTKNPPLIFAGVLGLISSALGIASTVYDLLGYTTTAKVLSYISLAIDVYGLFFLYKGLFMSRIVDPIYRYFRPSVEYFYLSTAHKRSFLHSAGTVGKFGDGTATIGVIFFTEGVDSLVEPFKRRSRRAVEQVHNIGSQHFLISRATLSNLVHPLPLLGPGFNISAMAFAAPNCGLSSHNFNAMASKVLISDIHRVQSIVSNIDADCTYRQTVQRFENGQRVGFKY